KGQKPDVTVALFELLHRHDIRPMAMIMFHEGQPYYTPRSLYGLFNQVDFLRRAGAITVQCTVHFPAVGTREYEETYRSGRVVRQLGRYTIPESKMDGNHVLVVGREKLWLKQVKLWGGYFAFYNPVNLIRALLAQDGSRMAKRRVSYQGVGLLATLWTGLRTLPYVVRLVTSSAKCHQAPPSPRVPVRHAPQALARSPALPPTREAVEGVQTAA